MTQRFIRGSGTIVLVLALAGCSELFAPRAEVQVPDGELNIVRVAEDTPPLTSTAVSFYAVRGERREVEMSYEVGPGYSGKCLLFVVPADALLRDAVGNEVAMGDSVLIEIEIPNPDLFLFRFSPAGLRFDPMIPAQIEIRYAWADVNGDGRADELDASKLALYKQERPGQAWEKIPSVQRGDVQEIRATINGFTIYALASD